MSDGPSDAASSASNRDETPSEKRVFDLLGNERRRSCVRYLASTDGTRTVRNLASQVAVRVSDGEQSPDDVHDSVYISLCQNHLPKLDDAGVVDYDSAEKTVEPGRAFPAVERHLDVDSADATDRASTRRYAGVSVATVGVLGTASVVSSVPLAYGVLAVSALHVATAVALVDRRP